MNNVKDSITIQRSKNVKLKKTKQKVIATCGYLVLNMTFLTVVYWTFLYKKEIYNQVIVVVLFVLGIISFFIVSSSDPGSLYQSVQTDVNAMRTLEQKQTDLSNDMESFEFKSEENRIESKRAYTPRNKLEENDKTQDNYQNIQDMNNNQCYSERIKRKPNLNKKIKELHIAVNNSQVSSSPLNAQAKKFFTSKHENNVVIRLDQVFSQAKDDIMLKSVNIQTNRKESYSNKDMKQEYEEMPQDSHPRGETVDIKAIEIENANYVDKSNIDKTNEAINLPRHILKKVNKESSSGVVEWTIDDYKGDFCMNCMLEVPIRAKHCKECNVCIATFDHHCGWIGNCVGERNKWKFWIFLSVHTVDISYIIVLSLLNFQFHHDPIPWIKLNALLFFNTLMLTLFLSFVLSLLVFQLQIGLLNQTTWENYAWHKIFYMKKLLSTSRVPTSPFHMTMTRNLGFIFCFKKYYTSTTSYIDWKQLFSNKN